MGILGTSLSDLAEALKAGNRRALARAITLIESGRRDHRVQALELLELLNGHGNAAQRIGLSGTPGVGKSTLIESLGMMLVRKGHRVAVLAVDPSSVRTGGSILGDKTRMELLTREANAFIRPSPSQSELGGVARRTREAILLCEAAGYDIILVETVGVGQSEVSVSQMTDIFTLLLAPAGGDELQGVKRGIMEMADLVLINKADGDLKPAALRTCADYAGALHLLRKRPQDPSGFPKAVPVSALHEEGIAQVWEDIQSLLAWRQLEGHVTALRAQQAQYWFEQDVRNGLLAELEQDPLKAQVSGFANEVASGRISASTAAQAVLNLMRKES